MKKLNRNIVPAIISAFLILILMNAAYGFAGMATNKSTEGTAANISAEQPDLNNVTQSDQDIQLLQHLIEVDAVQFESQKRLYVRETLIFKNIGQKDFSGTLRTWIPDGLDEAKVSRVEMMMDVIPEPIESRINGNILSWQDFIRANDPLPNLYIVEYMFLAEPEGTLTKSLVYTKKLAYPTLINYQYAGKPGLPSIVLKITKPDDSTITLFDENRDRLAPQDESMEGNSVIDRFDLPQFKELNIELSRPAVAPAGIAGYAVLGLLILLALSYPVIRKKSDKLQAMEGKIGGIFRRDQEEVNREEAEPEEDTEALQESAAGEDDTELSGKTRDELESEKSEILSKLGELDKDYSSGNLLDEAYEELRNPYRKRLENIDRVLEKSE